MYFTKFLGYLLALPITLFGFHLVFIPWCFGWYRLLGIRQEAIVFVTVPEKLPGFMKYFWESSNFDLYGVCYGNIIVIDSADMKIDDESENSKWSTTLTHEMTHVHQCMKLGLLQPILYFSTWIIAKLALKYADGYWDNIFEIEARRRAGQKIDVVGPKNDNIK